METENQKPTDLPAGSAQETQSFDEIVKGSEATIAEQAAAQEAKRGRGRPRKNPAPDEKLAGPQSSTAGEPKTSKESAASMRNLTEEMKPVLKDTVKVPFSLASAHFQEPDFEITDKEAETPSYYLGQFIRQSLPGLEKHDPKVFNFVAFLFSFFLLVLKKLPVFVKRKKAAAAEEFFAENPPAEPHGSALEADFRDLTPAPTRPKTGF